MGAGPDNYIKQINPVAGEDYSALNLVSGDFVITTPAGLTVTYKQ